MLSSFASLSSMFILTLLPEALIPPVTIKSRLKLFENSFISLFSSLKFIDVCLDKISNSLIIENSVIKSSKIPSTRKPLSSSLLVFAKGRMANFGFLFAISLFLTPNFFLPSPKIEKTSNSLEIFLSSTLPSG